MDMKGDIICRWRNATPETVCELVKYLPHEELSSENFRKRMESTFKNKEGKGTFFQTPYQLACQLGLYLEDKNKYVPRFTRDITTEEAQKYLEHWIQCYYAPNPFTKQLKSVENPVYVEEELVKYLDQNNFSANLQEALNSIFKAQIGNVDMVKNALNNYSKVISVDKDNNATLNTDYKSYMKQMPNRDDKKAFYENFDEKRSKVNIKKGNFESQYRPYITAIKTKPFILLAGISGTGKSRIVRELARACWSEDSKEYKSQRPKNFMMVQVKPNWHDSSELIGYVSRVSGHAEFVPGDFLRFIAKAWEDKNTPYFLCLDEMNLAPVEQYFAEYLSVLESRKSHDDGTVTTDPIIENDNSEWYTKLIAFLTTDADLRKQFNKDGISIPQNLVVVGTVNMDETTFSFSRKVLDRAMTIEMNEVNLHCGLTERNEKIGKLDKEDLIGNAVEGVDVYSDNVEVCNKVIEYLNSVNTVLNGTPFKVAYRTRNDFLLYVVNNLPYNKDENEKDLDQEYVIARALDEVTNMKVLSRIEGDDTKVSDEFLDQLSCSIKEGIKTVDNTIISSISLEKIKVMKKKLSSGYTSYWS